MVKMSNEFGLEYNESIVARVRAINAAGLKGEWKESDDSAKVKTKPAKMADVPERSSSTDQDTLHVVWDAVEGDNTGGSEIIYYSVYLNDETDPIFSTSGTSYLYEKPDGSTETSQQFRVTSSNIYGESEKSDLSLAIEFGSVPAKIPGLASSNIGSDSERATITWTNPGETIELYEFQILDKDTTEYKDANDIMEADQNLTDEWGREFDCADLIRDFGYQRGDKIVFRVRAKNSVGYSEWSYPLLADMEAVSLLMLIL